MKINKEEATALYLDGLLDTEIAKHLNCSKITIVKWRENEAMKEIKFRGKRLDNGEWVYGQPYQVIPKKLKELLSERTWISNRIESMTTKNGGITVSYIEVIPETVGQFTGLKDKNGLHDIYEGDICNNDGGMIGEVVFHESAWMFRWRSGNYYPLGQWVEVIGNKWDNPELLAKE